MNLRLIPVLTLALVWAAPALAAPKGVISFKPKKSITEGRPTPVRAQLSGRRTDFHLEVTFDQVAYGAACAARCARAQFLIDSDNDTSTGLQQGSGKPPTGADLAVLIEGTEDFTGAKVTPYLRVVVRQFTDEDRTIEDGDVVGNFDHRKDDERIKLDGKAVKLVIDASAESLTTARTSRLVFLAPGVRPLSAVAPGINKEEPRSATSAKVVIERGGSRASRARPAGPPKTDREARQRARQQSGESGAPTGPIFRSGGSAYDPNEKVRGGEGG